MLFFSNEKCTTDWFYLSTNDVTLAKCTVKSRTHTAIGVGSVHRSKSGVLLRNLALCTRHRKYMDNLHKAQLIPFSHKTIYLTVASQPIDVDFEI